MTPHQPLFKIKRCIDAKFRPTQLETFKSAFLIKAPKAFWGFLEDVHSTCHPTVVSKWCNYKEDTIMPGFTKGCKFKLFVRWTSAFSNVKSLNRKSIRKGANTCQICCVWHTLRWNNITSCKEHNERKSLKKKPILLVLECVTSHGTNKNIFLMHFSNETPQAECLLIFLSY